MTNPLNHPCPHLATPQELERDPLYQACEAQPGTPCLWARRYDGVTDPAFHSERLETACFGTPLSHDALDQAILQSGLV